MRLIKSAGPNDPARFTDCGTFEPQDAYSGNGLCANCPGWKKHHEPYASEERSRMLETMLDLARYSARVSLGGAPKVDAFVAEVVEWARRGSWLVHQHNVNRPDSRHLLYASSNRDRTDFGFPPILLVSQDWGSDSGLYAGGPLWGGARKGGILAVYPALHVGYRTNTPDEIRWHEQLVKASPNVERHLWTPHDLPAIVERLTGRRLDFEVTA